LIGVVLGVQSIEDAILTAGGDVEALVVGDVEEVV
jgi:hypothetical protein